MSVIIRLQNLPWSANALDIRQYFQGLSIPEGGVHIVGGELGDAFIAFSTDEDARQAFNLSNGKIKEVQIKLMLSSRTEMQKVIEAARKQTLAAFMHTPTLLSTPLPAVVPPVIPSAVPELKKDDKEREDMMNRIDKRDKRRSRTRSHERKDRSRDRERRDRHGRRGRSRSRSRERRERRRREHSRSRDRTRSKERERRERSRERKRIDDKTNPIKDEKPIGIWEPPSHIKTDSILNDNFSLNNNEIRRNLVSPNTALLGNGFPQREPLNRTINWPNSSNLNPPESMNKLINFPGSNGNRFSNGSRPTFPNQPFPDNSNAATRFNRQTDGRDKYSPQESSDASQTQQIEFSNCCVQLQPYYGGYGEIRRFFQGLFIHNTGIKFVNDDYGKRTGIVYIRFAYPEGKEQAIERNGNMLKNQTVEVLHLSDEAFESAVDRYHPEYQEPETIEPPSNIYRKNNMKYVRPMNSPSFSCLVIEDLPNYIKEQDISKMFCDYSLASILLVNRPRKDLTAYVKFRNGEDAKKALEDKASHIISNSQVCVKPCRDEIFEHINREQNELLHDNEMDQNTFMQIQSNCVGLSGLPLKTTDRDVTDFFSDVGLIPEKIHLINSSLGFTGEAFCEFCNIEDAQIALEKDGMSLGPGVITVKGVSRSEMDSILGIRTQKPMPPKNMSPNNSRIFFPPRNNFMPGPRGPPNFMGPRHLIRRFGPPQSDIGPPGCTVLMENVPYKAGLDEILEFFGDFEIIPDNILRKFNPNGKPSGETKVIFRNADDAYQAVEQRNRQKIRDRTIYLTLC